MADMSIATPVVGMTLVLLIAENAMDIGVFNPAKGGDPILFEQFFWFYSHSICCGIDDTFIGLVGR